MSSDQIGERFIATAVDLASDGRAIVKHINGRTFFVGGAWPGEEVEVEVSALKGRIGFATLIAVLTPHPQRIEPPCAHHGYANTFCGGCPWQFMEYTAQLAAKQARVLETFARMNLAEKVREIFPSSQVLGYRNRAQFKTDGQHIGFSSYQSNVLAPINDCLVLSDRNRGTLQKLKEQLPQKYWQTRKKDSLTTLDIDESHDAANVSVNQRLPFMQANAKQNEAMRQWLAQQLDPLAKQRQVLELFSGSGNFTEVIAAQGFAKVVAVEGVSEAIAQLNARSLANTSGVVKNLFTEDGMNAALHAAREADILVLDPPRDGLKNVGNLFAKKSKYRNVFYISCDLATLARDIAQFVQHKFKVSEIQPIDQFPQTPHIELMVALKKSS